VTTHTFTYASLLNNELLLVLPQLLGLMDSSTAVNHGHLLRIMVKLNPMDLCCIVWLNADLVNLNTCTLMKGKANRKHSLHEKTAAPVLLKPFIRSNE